MSSEAEIKSALTRLLQGDRLSSDESRALFERMLRGEMDEAQIASALSLMQARAVTLDELVGAARVMRSHVITVATPDDGVPLIDTCGTGGAVVLGIDQRREIDQIAAPISPSPKPAPRTSQVLRCQPRNLSSPRTTAPKPPATSSPQPIP